MVFGKLEAGILMEFLFFLLRIYAGGYHAKDELNCKILTYGSIVLFSHFLQIYRHMIIQHQLLRLILYIISGKYVCHISNIFIYFSHFFFVIYFPSVNHKWHPV